MNIISLVGMLFFFSTASVTDQFKILVEAEASFQDSSDFLKMLIFTISVRNFQ